METTRNFVKRDSEKATWSGTVHEPVKLTVDAPAKGKVEFSLDGKVLPEASAAYLINFALQSLQDAYAGAESLADAQGRFGKKYDALVAGTIGVRTGGSEESEFERVSRRMMLAKVRDKYGKDSDEFKKFDALDDDTKAEKLDALFVKNEAAMRPAVEAEIERLAELRKAKAAAKAVKIEVEI